MPPIRRLRPKMEHYGISASPDGMLEWEWAESRLQASRNYWVSTASPDGQPGAAPVWAVWLDGGLIFGVGTTSRKGRHLLANPRVIVHLESGDDVVIVEGRAEPLTDAAVLDRMLPVYAEKYGITPDVNDPNSLYLRVVPLVVLAWLEKDFPNSATRFEFNAN
ncbi:MAG: pyridoxamine 5'-phosphate oxidase family protein [Anaerolineae bacterium]|nr:pyridoxamine 5'-phosphate oxidase family protein [Anaerolineae bacterium]